MKIKLPALAGAALLFAGAQQSIAGTALDTTSQVAADPNASLKRASSASPRRQTNYESRLSSLAHPRVNQADTRSIVDIEDAKPHRDFLDATEPKKKQLARQNVSNTQQNNTTNAPQHSQILNTVMTPVPAGPNSPFRVPAWLTVKRQSSTTISSASQVPVAAISTMPSPSTASTDYSTSTSSSTKAPAIQPQLIASATTGTASAGLSSALNSTAATNAAAKTSSSAVNGALAASSAQGQTGPGSPNPASNGTSQGDYDTEDPAVPIAATPQQAVLQDPDASGKPKIAQNNPASTDSEPKRRGYPSPMDPVFPSTEYIGIAGTMPIGVPDTDPEYPLEKQIYRILPQLRKHRIKIYGWINPGMDYSSSKHSNIPQSYSIVPRRLELDQAIFRVERTPDTVQQEHTDWGFRATMLYGIDYRWTTSEGWYPASKELLDHNYLYGADPVELYGMFYIPKIAGHKIFQGMVLKYGRFISPPDIEAQLAPDNFLWTHSQMFTVDCYTQTGLLNTIKLNDNWTVQAGISAGADIAPWDKAAIPTGLFLARWVSKNNNDSIYGGLNSINNGRFRGARAVVQDQNMIAAVNGLIQQQAATGGPLGPYQNANGTPYQFNNLQPEAHDNLQQVNLTWSHRFNKKGTIVSMTEMYYLYQYNALLGGTVNNGPPHPYAALTGPGALIPGTSPALGIVNYTAFKITDKDYITLRPVDYLFDFRGERTGFATTYSSWTVGWAHRFNSLLMMRPEIRYERALSTNGGTIVTPYDNGTRRYQFTVGMDVIAKF